MPKLALKGGEKLIKNPFPAYNSIGKEEKEAAIEVLETGQLSKFFGSWGDRFYGGPKVQELERNWEKHFKVRNAISFNSWTSGLVAAVGAIGIEPGDEVIVSPWTMAASASAILAWNGIPVFADIEEDTFNLDPVSIEKNITPYTKAILVPDIFGHPADLDSIMQIAQKHNLLVIEDTAQAPNSSYKGRYTGTVANIGGYSLNYHKHIHTGEGGISVTDNDELAERMRLIRNHAEAVVGPKGVADISNMIGYNLRLGEIEAAMANEQLKKLPPLTLMRSNTGQRLSEELKGLKGLTLPVIKTNCTHVFYIYAFKVNEEITGVSRDIIIKALQAEGVPWVYGGYQLIHLLPAFQQKIAYGKKGFPWVRPIYQGNVIYSKGICPVAERLHEKEVMCLQLCQHNYTHEETQLVIDAFKKVWENLEDLKE